MPATFDMPIEKLFEYQGINPKPADFEEFWDNGLDEIENMDHNAEFILADFQVPGAECYDLYFTGTFGSRIHAKVIKPKNITKPSPAIVQFHGYSGHSGDWSGKLKYTTLGYTIASLDCRGQAGLSEDRCQVSGTTFRGNIIRGLDDEPANLGFRNIYLDTAIMTKIIMAMPEVDETKVGAVGGSQGGGLTLACCALVPEIKAAAPNFPFLSDYKRVWEMDLAKGAYEELTYYFKCFDPRHEREEEIFNKLGYVDIQHLAPRIKAKVMMGTGLMDTTCPPSTQFATYNKITSEKEVVFYYEFGHENLSDHEDKVMQFFLKNL
jgi:cephalosporin-C deacetylase